MFLTVNAHNNTSFPGSFTSKEDISDLDTKRCPALISWNKPLLLIFLSSCLSLTPATHTHFFFPRGKSLCDSIILRHLCSSECTRNSNHQLINTNFVQLQKAWKWLSLNPAVWTCFCYCFQDEVITVLLTGRTAKHQKSHGSSINTSCEQVI